MIVINKLLKDVFNNITFNSPLLDTEVEEIKFSKKLNSAIVRVKSNKIISFSSIQEFENIAVKCYELKSFKIKYKYVGDKIVINEEKVKGIIKELVIRLPYLRNMLDDYKVDILNNNITISLGRPNANFLKIKKIDEYIVKCIKTMYNNDFKVEFINLTKTNIEKPKAVKLDYVPRENNNENNIVANSSKPSKFPQRQPKPKFIKNVPDYVIIGNDITNELTDDISKITDEYDRACVEGEIFRYDDRKTKKGSYIVNIDIADSQSAITCKMFINESDYNKLKGKLKEGNYVKVLGKPKFDDYDKDLVIMIKSIVNMDKPEERIDNVEEKRVELHMHTKMSTMDGVSDVKDVVKRAIKWGHKAVAITDHGVAQSFPDAHYTIMKAFGKLGKKNEDGKILTQQILDDAPTKIIYGVEGYLVDDIDPNSEFSDTYCVFDLETTGFKANFDKITEVAVVKVKDGKVIDEYSTFVNPERNIPAHITEITGITNEMVKDAPTIDTVIQEFTEFTKDSTLVAHNAKFDMSFINFNAKENRIKVDNKILDTLTVSRELYEGFENHKLGTIAKNLNISLEGAHRAINDTRATAKVLLRMIEDAKVKNIDARNYIYNNTVEDVKKNKYNHIIILAKNYVGLKNLYKIISFSHIHYFYKKPRVLRTLLNRYREGLIIGSACELGELYQAVANNNENVENIAKFYDYLEIQPLGNNQFYIDSGKYTKEDLINFNKRIIELGDKLNIPVVATCDSHFLDEKDEIYRRIIMAGQGYSDADKQAPLYYRTTEEMFKEFDYLNEEKAKEIIITNTNKIADMCDAIQPVVDGTYPPTIEGSDQFIRELSYKTAKEIYGEDLPQIVTDRLEKELKPIIKYGFAVMYMIAMKLVKKSNADGYLVGSRGSVGSSFVATMTGITEVNPLPAHYICRNCKYSEFPGTGITTGVDMEDKICPVCSSKLDKNGMDIPFEVFLGFKGDKAPDIDLNFSGDNQAEAHAYTEVLFGKGKTFRAGTIATVADKTAYGFVKKYEAEKGQLWRNAEINRVSKGLTGVKRTTGQHPGGIIVVPADKEIYDFCPIQKPADDMRSKSVTTHFDFHSIHDNLLKLDILGHDAPTIIRMLEDLTNTNAQEIKLDEPKVMSLFSSTEALGVTKEQINSEVGTFAVPEFGTKFVRGMLVDTKPTTFGELVRISGLSHGTDVWLGNAQKLIEEGKATLKDAICTRDDIMNFLILKGVDPQMAFKTMEFVRKGRGLTEEMEKAMIEQEIPDWYIESCKKIKYMFPKAHAAAYVMMAYRIAYYKVYYPKEFYAVYYIIKSSSVNYDMMMNGKDIAKASIKSLENKEDATATDKDMLSLLEVINEMYERGIKFLPVDIYISDATKFLVEEEGIRPPLSSLTGFGEVDAKKLVEARKGKKFKTIEEVKIESKIGKVAMEVLEKYGCFKGMPKSSQITFLGM